MRIMTPTAIPIVEDNDTESEISSLEPEYDLFEEICQFMAKQTAYIQTIA